MGAIHNELRRGPLSRGLTTILGVEQGEVGLERFSESLQPVLDLFGRPEWALPRGEILFARHLESPAVAARNASVQLINPSTSKVLAVVEEILVRFGSTAVVEIAVEQGDSVVGANVTDAAGVSRDTRYHTLGEASQLTMHTSDTPTTAALPQLRVPVLASSPFSIRPLFVMHPNSKLFVFNTTVNANMGVTILWRERTAFQRELGLSP